MKNLHILSVFFLLNFSNCIAGNIENKFTTQDQPSLFVNNPFKGFSKFIFSPIIPSNINEAASIFQLVENELKHFGQVDKSKILKTTSHGEVIDLTLLNIGASLMYEIENLTDLNGLEVGVVRASLNFTTAVEIQKTKQRSRPYIWSCNCFLRGNTEKDLQRLVSESLNHLLWQFILTYSSVNEQIPIFDLQEPN